MKHSILVILSLILFSCSSDKAARFEITNEFDADYEDFGMAFRRSDLEKKIDIPEGKLPLAFEAGVQLPSQADDLDGDGRWDELFFIMDLDAGEKKGIEIEFSDPADYPDFDIRTNIRFAKKGDEYKEVDYAVRETHAENTITQEVWQMEGIAWENEKVGFRNYFDRRNGMDIFGKLTEEMVLDEVGYKDNPGYHEFNQDWGMDVLKVGNSLGAGSIGFMYKDSIYRIGDNGEGTCEVLVEGPLRSIFRFKFTDWQMRDQVLDVTQDVMIQAGKYYYESKVWYEGIDIPLQLITGIVNMKSEELHEVDAGEHYKAFYTHDKQSEDGTYMAMGLKVPARAFVGTSTTPDEGAGITQTYCVHLNVKPERPVSYRFYTAWEMEDAKWKDSESFEELLKGI